ncbi:MAG: type II secretion system secretin GspD [Bacteriovoracaceae bacterium]
MLTRCQKRKRFLSPLLFAALILSSQDSSAQFNKYRSKTDFNGSQVSAPITDGAIGAENISAEDAAAALKAAEDLQARADAAEEAEQDNEEEEDAFEDNSEDEANTSAFGSRVSPTASSVTSKKDGKYVNLNPETGFGPEIVESFDFPETDIMEITKHMQKLTGINLILDKDVKGKVSIIAPTPITVGDAWKAYLAALNMAGYSLVKTGAFYKVINARDIRYTPTKIYTGSYTPDTENYVMKVIALKYVSAAEIARNFRPFMTRYGRIIDIKQTNTVIIADTGSNINRMSKMVRFLDVPGFEESLQIVKVKNSSAQEIAKLLDTILKGGSGGAAGRAGQATPRFSGAAGGSGDTNSSSISRIIAEPRTNSIIAMANAEGAKQLKDLILKLDVKLVSSSSNRVHVYYLNYGDSEELSKTLQTIVSGAVAKDGAAGGATRFTSTLGGQSENAIFSAEVKITSDKNNNALVVTASPTDWLTLKDVIGRLDIPRDQVYVEGMILEANVTNTKGFGVEWAGAYGQGNAQRAGLTNTNSDLLNLLSTGVPTALGGFFAGAGIGPTRNISDGRGGTIKVNAVNAFIKAIASHGNTNILATPQILALDNTEATFEVGDTTPVLNTTVTGTGISQNSFTSQEAKLSLKITPQINKVTRFVKLKINQKIDDFKATNGAAAGSALPTTTRSAVNEVMVRDRDTIAMGGLLRDKETISSNKIPVLGDIPVLGWLFKNKTRTVEKVNLLFFMTPKILAPYTKVAAANTKEVVERSNRFTKDVFTEDDRDPNTELTKNLIQRMDQQAAGPLYDAEDADIYKNLNERQIEQQDGDSGDSAEMDTPNYQEIKNSVQETTVQ